MAGRTSVVRALAVMAALVLVTTGCAWITRSSVFPNPGRRDPASLGGISASGRYTSFGGIASDYLDVTISTRQVFVRDNLHGSTHVMSVATDGQIANDDTRPESISDNGRFVAFDSVASNLAPADVDGLQDAFVHDRRTGVTTMVSRHDDGSQITDLSVSACAMSGDGNVVALCLSSPEGIPPAVNELAIRNLSTGTTRMLPHLHDAPYPSVPVLSFDGSLVAYGDGTLNSGTTVWRGIARTDTGSLVKDLGSAPLEYLGAAALDVDISGDGTTYAVTESHHKYDAATTGTVTVGRVDGTAVPTVHHYRWAQAAVLSRDGSVLAVQILLPSGLEVLAIDRGADPPQVVSADSTGTHIVTANYGVALSADGRWVAFDTTEHGTLGGSADDTYVGVYTRSVAQALTPPS